MQESEEHPDVVLIGSGVMSATLATLIHALEPDWSIHLYERLEGVAAESSDAWNNAGTGHSAFCELNYTPQNSLNRFSKVMSDLQPGMNDRAQELDFQKVRAQSFRGSRRASDFWLTPFEQHAA